MASILNPYLQFDGNARDALSFYQGVFGGTSNVMTFGDMGAQDDTKDLVMHGQLETEAGYTLMAADMPASMGSLPDSSGRITVSLSGDDVDTLRGYFEKLSDGGNVVYALEKQMWGDYYGQLVDKYGIAWMANISGAAVEGDASAE